MVRISDNPFLNTFEKETNITVKVVYAADPSWPMRQIFYQIGIP
jgi:hypothetical protein